jgi:hypothetical protein
MDAIIGRTEMGDIFGKPVTKNTPYMQYILYRYYDIFIKDSIQIFTDF